ncbi:MAG: LysR family transcriptional regulator, partial [Alphaproteobacteria bacterium]|nr:LysR family transcriptional regulator [Alphaproteobacteria bacterium]
IGVKLLNRTPRRIELTEAGIIYFARSREIIEAARVAHEQLRDMAEVSRGHLRISMLPDLWTLVFAPLFAEFSRLHPGITFDIDFSPRRVEMLSERFDIAIRVGEQPDSSLIARKLAAIQPCLYASPDYLRERGTPTHPREIAGHDCIRIPLGAAGVRWKLMRDGEIVEVEVGGKFAVNNMDMVRRLASLGMGIGMIDQGMARDGVAAGELTKVLPHWRLPPSPVYVFTVTRLLPAKIRSMIDFMATKLRPFGDTNPVI